jgi:beta-N-acetylhexosaminidase
MEDIDSNQFNVNLVNFKGPLDTLLDLAKSQKVNLEEISITLLADQFLEFITNAKNINLEIASEYHKHKIGTSIKHIPGHGLAKVDSHKRTPIVKEGINKLIKTDFYPFKNKQSLLAMTAHIIYQKIDPKNTATHSSIVIKLIRKTIGFKNLIISDDISMKGLKFDITENVKKSFSAGCNLALHCNGKLPEMIIVAKNSPKVNSFILKKTSQFYKILS